MRTRVGVVFITEQVSDTVQVCELKGRLGRCRAEVTRLKRRLWNKESLLRHYRLKLRHLAGVLSYLADHPYGLDTKVCGRSHQRDSRGQKKIEVLVDE